MKVRGIRISSTLAIAFSALLLAAVMMLCIPQAQALADDGTATVKEQVGTLTQASADAVVPSANAPEQASGIKSKYGLLAKNGKLYPCNKKGKKLGKYWKVGSKVTTIFVAANAKKVPALDKVKYYYKAYIRTNAVTSKLSKVVFLTKKGKSNVKTIAADCFLGESKLKTLKNFNKTKVTSIGAYAFARTGIKSISLPKTLTTIGKYAFAEAKSLKSISGLEKTRLSSIGEDAFLRSAVTRINLPASVKSIGAEAFAEMGNLSAVSGLEKTGVAKINNYTFSASPRLTSVALPASCKSIGEGAFYKCSALATLKVPSTTPVTGGYGMLDSTKIATIQVPAGMVASYKSATYWKDYASAIRA